MSDSASRSQSIGDSFRAWRWLDLDMNDAERDPPKQAVSHDLSIADTAPALTVADMLFYGVCIILTCQVCRTSQLSRNHTSSGLYDENTRIVLFVSAAKLIHPREKHSARWVHE